MIEKTFAEKDAKAMNQIPGQNGRRKKKRFFINTSGWKTNKRQVLLLCAALVCLAVLIVGLCNVGGYVKDYVDTQQAANDMRSLYYTSTDAPSAGPGNASAQTEMPVQETPSPAATPLPTQRPLILESIPYPHNGRAKIQDKFQTLRQKNPDVTAWLKIGTQLDEAVVQRDNVFYLRRDWQGKDNANGALFLDQDTKWSTRPYTMMVYGHNMKSGAMFGKLRTFEKHDYYQDHAIITFDTAYEDGRFVVIAIGTYSLNNRDENFLNLGRLDSRTVSIREKEIERLMENAVLTSPVEVNAQDQLLLLITCVDDDDERRILTARRIRDNETEAELIAAVKEKFAY